MNRERIDYVESPELGEHDLDEVIAKQPPNGCGRPQVHPGEVCQVTNFKSVADSVPSSDSGDDCDEVRESLVTTPSVHGDAEGEELLSVEPKRIRLRRGITMDSGAAHNVMPRRMVRDQSKIRPSEGSKRGAHYVAANDGRIPNEGEYDFAFSTAEGIDEVMTFQIAEVNKALGSISYLVDNGYRVVFDKDPASGRDMSCMTHKESNRVSRFRRDRNVWILDAVVSKDKITEAPFQRRG